MGSRQRLIGVSGVVAVSLACAATASAQSVFGLGAAVGGAMVQSRTRGDWTPGVMPGLRAGWLAEGSGIGVALALDVQPFRATGGTAGEFRALYLVPSVQFGSGNVRVSGGVGVAMLRFDEPLFDDEDELAPVTRVGGLFVLPHGFYVEGGARRTGFVRDSRKTIWSIQLVRLWAL